MLIDQREQIFSELKSTPFLHWHYFESSFSICH